MPIKQVFEKKDDAPEWMRDSLLEHDGQFVFEAELPHEVRGLKAALEGERRAKGDAEKALKTFEGIDAERARKLLADAEKLEADKLKNKGDWETRETQLKEQLAKDLQAREQQFQTELKAREDRINKLQSALEKSLIEAQATVAITNSKGAPALLLPHVLRQVKVVEENGEFVARVLDAQGQPRIANVKGDPFTIANLVDEMRGNEIFGRAFEASNAGGSGAPPSNKGGNGTKTMTRADFDRLGHGERAAFMKGGGQLTD
jgi:hypothetical protein